MSLSYIIPTYGRPQLILFLLDNIRRQSVNKKIGDIEIIVSVDLADKTLGQYKSLIDQYNKVLREIEDVSCHYDLKLLINNTNGLVYAKNKAVNLAKSEIIMMLDDDLYMSGSYVEMLYEDIHTTKNVGACSGYIVSSVPAISHTQPSSFVKSIPSIDTGLQTLKIANENGEWRSVFGQKEQVMDWSLINRRMDKKDRYSMDYFVNSYMFKKSVFEKVNGYNILLNSKTSAHEEVDFTFRIKKLGYELLFNPFAKMWHITIGCGGIYKGNTFNESKKILEQEYKESLMHFLKSIN